PGGNGIGVAAEVANAISIPDVFDNGGTGHRSDLRDRERPARRDAGVRGIWWPGGLRGVFSFRSAAGFHAGQRLSYLHWCAPPASLWLVIHRWRRPCYWCSAPESWRYHSADR